MRPLSRIERIMMPHYGNRDYHNWGHALHVRDVALVLAERCRHYGIDVSEVVIDWAGLGHDSDFDTDPRKLGCRTKEEVSFLATAGEMRKLGYPEKTILAVGEAIKPTNAGVLPVTTEAKILRAADLSRMAGSYSDYREDFERLTAEFGFMNGWDFFWPNMRAMIEYLWPEIRLTPEYWNINHGSDWHTRVAGNIIRNYQALCAERGEMPKVVLEIGPGRLPISLFRKFSNELIIGIEPEERERKVAAVLSVEMAKHRGTTPEIIIPGRAEELPIETGRVSEFVMANVVLRHPDALCPQEILRVLSKSHGTLEIIESYSPDLGYGFDADAAIEGIVRKLPGFSLLSIDRRLEEDGFPCVEPDAFRLMFQRE